VSDEAGPTEKIRRAIEASSDPRVARTRAALFTAATSLASEGEPVTVSSVARAAGVSRASFYSHFEGLDDLSAGLMHEAFRRIADLYSADADEPLEAMRHSQERLVRYFADNRALFAGAAAVPVSREGYLLGVRTMAAVIESALVDHPRRPDELLIDATARYIAGAAYGLIDAWLTGELELTSTQLVEHLVALLPPWFSGTH